MDELASRARGRRRSGRGGGAPAAGSSPASPGRSTWTRCSPGRSRRRRPCPASTRPSCSWTTPGASPVVAALGISAEEAERRPIAGPPDGREARAIEFRYRYTDAEVAAGDRARPRRGSRSRSRTRPAGSAICGVFTRDGDRRFGDEDVRAARGARRPRRRRRSRTRGAFREARQLADLDALTGLHNRRFFHETLVREVARAHRYDRQLALVVFDLDDFKDVNDRIGHLAGDTVLAEAAERVRSVVRSADVACRIGGDEFAVIVPESPLSAATLLVVADPGCDLGPPDRPGRPAPLLGRDRRAAPRRRLDRPLRARRRAPSTAPRTRARTASCARRGTCGSPYGVAPWRGCVVSRLRRARSPQRGRERARPRVDLQGTRGVVAAGRGYARTGRWFGLRLSLLREA